MIADWQYETAELFTKYWWGYSVSRAIEQALRSKNEQ